ncbi:pentatricopeptide repeat-containing protein At4g17616 [Ziziphus jujuba]|uniref:Pentatricopeptide repeat-containing protein At4g17616 n=1 Tax=Ziziphus jujuba TaxID=326968 RepID=A0A6P6FP99_ZIZJJ|nr:pentatricopeptide repeat-containing protein At4g17616 [Ziziphus jujuba]
MAILLLKEILVHPRFIRNGLMGFRVASAVQRIGLLSVYSRESVLSRSFVSPAFIFDGNKNQNLSTLHFSTSIQPQRLCWEGSSHGVLLKKLELALKNHQVEEAWESFNDFKKLYGFPENSILHMLITEMSYSSDHFWLRKASDLVLLILKEKSALLKPDILTKLSLSLARSQIPSHATKILRLMLDKEVLPSMDVLLLVVLHLVKTEIGTHLASNFLIQICECYLRLTENKSNRAKLMKPDTMIFNLVLHACVRFKLSFKGQQMIELMAQAGVIADAHTIVIIAQIHEMNGQRDEIKKYKAYIDQLSSPFVCHYRQFYDSLLKLHFKFNDIGAAAELVLDFCRYQESVPVQRDRKELEKAYLVPIGSHNLRTPLKMQIRPALLHKDSVLKLEGRQELVMFRNGQLVLSNKALTKLICGYKKVGNISEMSKILLQIQKELCSIRGSSLCSDVIGACIHLGWLEIAHDILDDMEAAGAPMDYTNYMSLLIAYSKGKMFREAKALLKQMRKAGIVMNLSDEVVLTAYQSEVVDNSAPYMNASSLTGKSNLAESFVQGIREEEKAIPPMVYEINSSIYFFCKAKMIGDALRTYRKMQDMKIQPTLQTFTNLVCGYSSLGMYRDITILWGDIKRNMDGGTLVVSRDLYEYLLMNFLQGGYFERVMEVIGLMEESGMYTDKWMYRSEFLKLHKNLYRNLKASEARTEAQKNRLRYVLAFRKWAGIA